MSVPTLTWTHWDSSRGTPQRPRTRGGEGADTKAWDAQSTLDDISAAMDAERVYASVDELASAMRAQLATLSSNAEFRPWVRDNPGFKPRLSGLISTAQGVRRVTALLDTGATHCFICARLAAALGLPPSGQPGPPSVATAAVGGVQGLGAPVLIHLCLGDLFRESMSISPMDMDVGDDLILGWDWISSHDLRHLFQVGQVGLRSGPAQLQLDLLPAAARSASSALSTVIGHGEMRRLLRQIDQDGPTAEAALNTTVAMTPTAEVQGPADARSSTGWSRPMQADHAELAAREAAERLAARERRRHGGPGHPPPPLAARFVDGLETLRDGTELHLASFCLADAELRLEGTDNPAFATLTAKYADVLGGAPPGLPPERGMELVLETGDAPMPRSRPVKRLSEGELAELRAQLVDLLDRGWIQHSTAGHAAAVVFARKPDGTWRICYDYRGLNAITRPAVEPLPHIDALLDGTRGSHFFTKLDLSQSYHQLRVRESDRWKTSFRSQLGQFEWNVVPFGLQGSSSLLMRVMNQALTVGLDFPSGHLTSRGLRGPGVIHGGVPGASGPLGRCALVYMDDCLVHSPTLEQHLLDVAEVLEIFRRRQLYAKRSKCEFGRQELGFLGHRLSPAGVAVDPRKVQSILEWTTPTSCSEVRRFTGLTNYYRRFVEGYAEVAAPLTALGSPTARFSWTPAAQASFDALKQALTSAPVLRTFDPGRRAVLTTDASNIAVAAILTQPDEEGHQHPIAYESRKLTAAERNYPAHVLELLAVVHAMRVFRHYLLGSGAPRPPGCWSDFDLRTDNQAITWLKTNRHLNKMYVRWLDEIGDFRFDVTHLPGNQNPSDPLSRRGFAGGVGPAPATGDSDLESQQELFSRLGRDAPTSAVLAVVRAGWARNRRAAAATFADARGGSAIPSTTLRGGALSPPGTCMFVALAGAELALGTGTACAPTPPVPSDAHFLSPAFVQTLVRELATDTFFGPIMRGAAATLGRALVDRHGAAILDKSRSPAGGGFLVQFGLLYRRGQNETDRLCIPAGGDLRAQVLRECHDGPLGGHFGRAKTGSLVRRLAFWVGQDIDVAEYVRSCQTCQRTKADHCGPRGLLHPLPLPSRRGGMIGVDWIAGLPTTAAGFDMIQNHVDLLSGKVHAVPTRTTATAADAAGIIRDMCLRSGSGFPDVLVVDHDPKFTSEVFRTFVKGMGSCLIVGSAYHKNTNAKVERANGVIGDTLRAYANGRKDDWDKQLPLAEFAINNAASTLGGGLTPFFIDRGAHPRLPLSPPHDARYVGESPAHFAERMRAMEATVQELVAAAQATRKAKLDAGRVDTVFKVGDQVLLRTKELLDAADIGKLRPRWDGPFKVTACPSPNAYTLALPRKMRCSPTVNVDRLKPFFERVGATPAPGPVSDVGQEGEHEVELLLNRRKVRGVTRYLVRWKGHTSADDEWLRAEELTHCAEKVVEYDAAAPRRRAALQGASSAVPPAVPTGGFAPLLAPAGFRIAAMAEVPTGVALVGRPVLYRWPMEGWVPGKVARVSRTAGFSHVVRYGRVSALGAVESASLLDAASHGPAGRWVLLLPTR